MSALANLKLIVAKRPSQVSPVFARRNAVSKRLAEQIELAKAKQEGRVFAATKLRRVKNAETGEVTKVEAAKRVKAWWFTADNGKVCVSLRYGAKLVELAKGKTGVELANAKDLVTTLETLKEAVVSGELDTQIEAVSSATKAAFKK
jgi:hypothetical protein